MHCLFFIVNAAEYAEWCVGVQGFPCGLIWVHVALGNRAWPELFFNTALIGHVFMPAMVRLFDLAEFVTL